MFTLLIFVLMKTICVIVISLPCPGSGKPTSHDRKSAMTPNQRESVPAKSPVSGGDPNHPMASHSPFDPHHRPMAPGEPRFHLPPHLDPTLFHRAVLDPGRTHNTPCYPDPPSMDSNSHFFFLL